MSKLLWPQRCITLPKDVHILILELMKCYLTLEKGLSDVSKLSILKWGDYSGLSGQAQFNDKRDNAVWKEKQRPGPQGHEPKGAGSLY